MKDAPEFVQRAERLAEYARTEVAALRVAIACDRAGPSARSALLGCAEGLRATASQLDVLVGHIEGRLAAKHQAEADTSLRDQQPGPRTKERPGAKPRRRQGWAIQ